MTSRPTALRALLVAIPDPEYRSYPIVCAVRERLEAMVPEARGAGSIRCLYKAEHCTRAALLETLRAWVEDAEPGQPHLFYFHGHGGRASFDDLSPEQGPRISYYLQILDQDHKPRSALFDVELSGLMGALHTRCGGNLSVLIDSCHSGGMAKGPPSSIPSLQVQQVSATPKWIAEIMAKAQLLSLAASSHPGIVRLTGSSPARRARALGGIGRFTRYWLESLKSFGDEWWRCSWTLLAHRVRQRVIEEGRRESQWVSLAGPGDRLLLSLAETPPARAVGLVEFEGQRWLRAGAVTGTRRGDRWVALAPLAIASEPEFERLEILELDEPQANRARIDKGMLGRGNQQVQQVYAATLARVVAPTRVEVVGSLAARLALADTTWLELGDTSARYLLRTFDSSDGRMLALSDRQSRWATLRVDDDAEGRAKILELLEDRARGERLLDTIQAIEAGTLGETARPPISISLGLDDAPLDFDAGVPRLEHGQALWVAARNTDPLPKPNVPWQTYFVAVVLIDGLGRPLLLNTGQPDGIELGPSEHGGIGRRLGANRRGLLVDWAKAWRSCFFTPPGDQRVELLCLLCDRPLPLAHLTHAMPGGEVEAFHLQGLESPELSDRGTKSERPSEPPPHRLARAQAWGVERFELCVAGMRDR